PKRLFSKPLLGNNEADAQSTSAPGARRTIQVRRRAVLETGVRMNEKILADLSARLAEAAAANPAKDLEKNFRGMLAGAFARLDLVTRQEYDVQAEVLARAR